MASTLNGVTAAMSAQNQGHDLADLVKVEIDSRQAYKIRAGQIWQMPDGRRGVIVSVSLAFGGTAVFYVYMPAPLDVRESLRSLRAALVRAVRRK